MDEKEKEEKTLALQERIVGYDVHLQEFIEKTSIDVMGPATRDYSNKLVISSAFGALVSTFGVASDAVGLWGFKVDINVAYVIPLLIIAVIVFHMAGLAVLAGTDVRRWHSVYNSNARFMKTAIDELDEMLRLLRWGAKELAEETGLVRLDKVTSEGGPNATKQQKLDELGNNI